MELYVCVQPSVDDWWCLDRTLTQKKLSQGSEDPYLCMFKWLARLPGFLWKLLLHLCFPLQPDYLFHIHLCTLWPLSISLWGTCVLQIPIYSFWLSPDLTPSTEIGFCCCLVTKSCLSHRDPVDCSLSGSSVSGIFQAKILKWVAISFSRGSSWPWDWIHVYLCLLHCRRILTHWATWEAPKIFSKHYS